MRAPLLDCSARFAKQGVVPNSLNYDVYAYLETCNPAVLALRPY